MRVMRKLLIGLLLTTPAFAGTLNYAGTWQTTYKTQGPATVKIYGPKAELGEAYVYAYVKSALTGMGYEVTGTVKNKVFSGYLSSNGRKWTCTGPATYGAHTLKFTLYANGTGFVVNGSK